MSDAHGKQETYTIDTAESDPKSSSTLIVGAVGVILTVVIVLLLEVLFHRTVEAENRRKIVEEQPVQLLELQEEQIDRLSTYRVIDAEKNIVAIPIERAMALIVEENGSRPAK